MEPVTAAGGVLFKRNEKNGQPDVVLIYRRGVWDLPKGKLDAGETIEECAVREVAEEIGLSDPPEIVASLIETFHEYEQNATQFGKTTHWFVMKMDKPGEVKFNPDIQEGIQKVDWCDLKKAKKLVGYQNLENVLDALDVWYNGN